MHGDAITVESLTTDAPAISGQDPMEIRWGINPICRDKPIERNRADGTFVPYGKWFPIQHREYTEEFHSVDEQAPRGIQKMRTAQDAQMYFEECIGARGPQGKMNWGFQSGFHGEKDAGKMAVISKALLPSLPDIRRVCAENHLDCPISTLCEGQDDLDFGERETCPTCWLQWIQSPACEAYMDIVAANGMVVLSGGDERVVTPSKDALMSAKATVTRSLQIGLKALDVQWRNVLSEFDKGERKGLDEGSVLQGVRKDIHETAPQHRQMEMVKQFAQASGGNNNDALLAALAQSQMQTNQLLGQLVVQNGVAANVPPTTMPVTPNLPPNIGSDAYAMATEAHRKGAEMKSNGDYAIGGYVLCDGQAGQIVETKLGGWFVVKLENGETQTVRKDKLQEN